MFLRGSAAIVFGWRLAIVLVDNSQAQFGRRASFDAHGSRRGRPASHCHRCIFHAVIDIDPVCCVRVSLKTTLSKFFSD